MISLKDTDQDLINHWYIAALENEVGNKPITRTIYDIPYVLFRDEKNQVVVFVDQCIHRGARLSEGSCDSGKLRCPYHGWRFDSSGHVCEVPSEGPDGTKKDWKLRSVPFVVQDGCVWIWPGEVSKMNTPLPDWRFPEINNPKFARYFMITDFQNEVTHLVQNFMDVPHTVYVHAKWFRNRKNLKVPIHLEVKNSRVKVTYEQKSDSIGFMDRILNSEKKPMEHTDEYIFPNITRVDYRFGSHSFIINSQCTPVSRYQTRVYTWIAYKIGILTHLVKPFMQYYTRKVIMQDVDIMLNHGMNLEKFEKITGPIEFNKNQGFHSTQADELHLMIDRMRSLGRENRQRTLELNADRQREFWI